MKRVLLVDDDQVLLAALRRVLQRRCTVETATSGADALIKYVAFQPDVVVADLVMPTMTGLELLTELQARGRCCRVILMSGRCGAVSSPFEMIPKPCDSAELVRRVCE